MASVAPGDALCHLRQAVADLDPSSAASFGEAAGLFSLGLPEVDAALQGGLVRGALHELAAAKPTPQQSGAITGFALALAARAVTDGRPALWIQTDFAALEAGLPYGPGLDLFGLPLRHLLILRVSRPLDVLWAIEEALKSRGVAAWWPNCRKAARPPISPRRAGWRWRRARGGGLGLLLRHRPYPLAECGDDPLGDRCR